MDAQDKIDALRLSVITEEEKFLIRQAASIVDYSEELEEDPYQLVSLVYRSRFLTVFSRQPGKIISTNLKGKAQD